VIAAGAFAPNEELSVTERGRRNFDRRTNQKLQTRKAKRKWQSQKASNKIVGPE
jgi:hypothetical protein